MQLNPVYYKWINGDLHDHNENHGYLANEFSNVFPNLVGKAKVHGNDKLLVEDETCLSINQDIVPFLVSSIQSLYKEVQDLKSEVNRFKDIFKMV